MRQLIIILTLFIVALSYSAKCQNNRRGKFEGRRTFKILDIKPYKLPDHFVIEALDSLSNENFVILSDKSEKLECCGNCNLHEITKGQFYTLELSIYPLFPLTIPEDSVNILFHSSRVEVDLHGMVFSKDYLPYFSDKICRNQICLPN